MYEFQDEIKDDTQQKRKSKGMREQQPAMDAAVPTEKPDEPGKVAVVIKWLEACLWLLYKTASINVTLLCRLHSIVAHRDHFVGCLSVNLSVCLSGSHTFLVVTHSYVLQAAHAFLGMLPLFYKYETV